ncbi:hypothetical protein E2C01_078394 [Portunus trituberculatus]|uniref:Uncharacterized protein n=1 Tax=Portunus trituberculatus TaxID=210409 RepID=A0A5B7INQ8_PORTR|nr:hypothetical protein [Portunus trituberculatus]
MCEIMNERFKTVLTAEDDFPEPRRTLHCQGLQEIAVHKEDIGRLLDKLDGVSGWVLKECKEQLLDLIWGIITSSINEGKVPLE